MTKIANPEPIQLDAFDRKILAIVQKDNQLSHAQLGDRVGLSTSAVRRRLSVLRETGVIARDISFIHPDKFGVMLIVTLSFGEESLEAYEAIDAQVSQTPEIKQSYHVSGSNDYILIVHGPSLKWYEQWAKQTFMTNPAIRRYSTNVVWSCKKFETALSVF